MIYEKTKERFDDVKEALFIVHDRNIKSFALEINKEVKLEGFKASGWFVNNFKRTFGITERTITNFVTKKKHSEKEDIQKKASDFVISVKRLIEENQITLNRLFNMDQSAFLKEQHSRR